MKNENPVFCSLEFIERQISEKLTVENISSNIYFSKYHYQRLFREIVGESVMEYVTKRRLTLAGRALLESNASIVDIALDYGYDSREGFSRSFKAYMGVTPTEYRKYSLTAISQKIIKEKCTMFYSKTTDEIIRELNDFIVTAKETANYVRKNGLDEYASFWGIIADKTDSLADDVKNTLTHITTIAEEPDEITNRFIVIKVIEDVAFQSNLMAFNVGLKISRGKHHHAKTQESIREMYLELARAANLKAGRISEFFNELSALIFNDMRKTAEEKILAVIRNGNTAVTNIVGYNNIMYEVNNIVKELSATPVKDITATYLDDCLFRLDILSFTATLDSLPDQMLNGLSLFKKNLSETVCFFKALAMSDADLALERTPGKFLKDVTFQMNLMLFYTRDELADEKLGKLLEADQKKSFAAICENMNNIIGFMHNANEESAYNEIPDRLYEIVSQMNSMADALKEHGGSIKFLANEMHYLADRSQRIALMKPL